MTLTLVQKKVPLTLMEHGEYRVEGTRIPLDTIVYEFKNGSSPEEIIMCYDTLKLADVYKVIAYYLDNKEAVDEYIKVQEAKAAVIENEIREQFKSTELHDRLLKCKRERNLVG